MYQVETNKQKRAILLGMCIGDGYITNQKHSKALQIRHSVKQRDYLIHKKNLLEQIFEGRTISIKEVPSQNGVQIAIGNNKLFRIYRKWLYPNGIKTPSRVLQYLDLQSIAIWYMDDGCLSKKKKDGKIHAYELFLNTYLTKEENQKIIDWFKSKYDIQFGQVKDKGKYRLRMGTKEARRFICLIEDYIIPSMEYKIDIS